MRYHALFITLILMLGSCTSIRVAADYDRDVNFENYKSFAFFKPGIDKAAISDLDKKRILKAIESAMLSKGFVKSEKPDVLISIFTKAEQNINIYQNNNWAWNPWWWGPNYSTVQRVTEGTLYIDLIDAQKKELIWQGMGSSILSRNMDRKEAKINEMVIAVLEKYPPLTK